MQVSAHITNLSVINHFQKMPARLDDLVKKSVQDVSREAYREIVGKEGLSKYGRHDKGTPTPSPPGEPPAQISTMLRQTVTIMPIRRHGFAHYSQQTMPTMPYARVQELGGTFTTSAGTTVRIPPRPFIAPARNRLLQSGKAKEIFSRRILKELNKRG